MKNRYFRALAVGAALAVAACAPTMDPGAGLEPGAFGVWDANDDGFLDTNEFGANWAGTGTLGVWDANDDGFLDENEWGVGVGNNTGEFGLFDDWDIDNDNRLAVNEFGPGSFGVFDDNRDGLIDDNEWGAGMELW